mmetsp:Transcript_45914/g.90607  ORF Transcript_45914/g.90607 Transcript_45914/m.90607 type:complete len:325 (+) Transcript_45914:267-1241(+)
MRAASNHRAHATTTSPLLVFALSALSTPVASVRASNFTATRRVWRPEAHCTCELHSGLDTLGRGRNKPGTAMLLSSLAISRRHVRRHFLHAQVELCLGAPSSGSLGDPAHRLFGVSFALRLLQEPPEVELRLDVALQGRFSEPNKGISDGGRPPPAASASPACLHHLRVPVLRLGVPRLSREPEPPPRLGVTCLSLRGGATHPRVQGDGKVALRYGRRGRVSRRLALFCFGHAPKHCHSCRRRGPEVGARVGPSFAALFLERRAHAPVEGFALRGLEARARGLHFPGLALRRQEGAAVRAAGRRPAGAEGSEAGDALHVEGVAA